LSLLMIGRGVFAGAAIPNQTHDSRLS